MLDGTFPFIRIFEAVVLNARNGDDNAYVLTKPRIINKRRGCLGLATPEKITSLAITRSAVTSAERF